MPVFGIVGFLGLVPSADERLGTFISGFITYPEALSRMPGSSFFVVVFFFTLSLLGLTSTFALLEGVVTTICDTEWGRKLSRPWWATLVAVVSFPISLVYCTEFGYELLDAVDTSQLPGLVLRHLVRVLRRHDAAVPAQECHRPGRPSLHARLQRRLRSRPGRWHGG